MKDRISWVLMCWAVLAILVASVYMIIYVGVKIADSATDSGDATGFFIYCGGILLVVFTLLALAMYPEEKNK